jgi:glycosyltransferase involved in cell wall biosynthesis
MTPRTILQIIPHLDTGGAEVGCLHVAQALKKAGHHPLIATHGGRLMQACQQDDIPVITMPVHSKSPRVIAHNTAHLKRLIKHHNIDLIHVRSRAPAWSVHFAATNTPWISTYHGAYKQTGQLKKRYNAIMTKGNAIIAPSHFMAEHIKHHYPHVSNKIVTIPRGIDLQATKPCSRHSQACLDLAKQWQIQPTERLILLPARITRLKGHPTCIEAAKQTQSWLRSQKIRIIFLGNTNKKDYCQSLIKTIKHYGLDDIISIHNHCDNMQAAYALADLILICSTEPESFGRTAVEAQAMGKLVMGTNHGGCQETISHQRTGWLVPPGDRLALANTWMKILGLSEQTGNAIKDKARDHAYTHYSHHTMCAHTIATYQKVIQSYHHTSNTMA